MIDSFTLYIVALLASIHYVADFLLQSRTMAERKSSSWKWLGAHVATYTVVLLITTGWPLFALVNGAAHFCTDAVTSRMTTRLWKTGRVHDFFAVIGGDQLIHSLTFIATLYLFT